MYLLTEKISVCSLISQALLNIERHVIHQIIARFHSYHVVLIEMGYLLRVNYELMELKKYCSTVMFWHMDLYSKEFVHQILNKGRRHTYVGKGVSEFIFRHLLMVYCIQHK